MIPIGNIVVKECDMQKDVEEEKQFEPVLIDDSMVLQSSLFGTSTVIAEPPDPAQTPYPPLVRTNPLTDQSSLAACALPYRQELTLRGKSNYTVTCFLSDLKMFSDFVGQDTPVGRLTKEKLTDWLMKLKFGTSGQPPAPKTMAPRGTFLQKIVSLAAN